MTIDDKMLTVCRRRISSSFVCTCSRCNRSYRNDIQQNVIRASHNIISLQTGAQPRLKSWGGPRFGSQHRGACAPHPANSRAGYWAREGAAPSRCEGPRYHPRKMFENSDAKSRILVTICCEISCFLKATAKTLGTNTLLVPNLKVGGLVSPAPTVVAPMLTNIQTKTRLLLSKRRKWKTMC